MMRQGVTAVVALALAGCFAEPRAPKEYVAVASSDPADRQCPDLSGSYAVAPELVRRLAREPLQQTGTSMRLTFVRHRLYGGFVAYWHQPRAQIEQVLAQMYLEQPQVYARWRERLLSPAEYGTQQEPRRFPLPAAALGMGEEYSQRVDEYRPRCDQHWIFAKSGDGPGEGRSHEVWLARGRDGALLAKTVFLRHTTFNNFGSVGHMNLGISGVDWQRLGMPVEENITPFSPSELAVPRRAALRPVTAETRSPRCPDGERRLVDLNQKILSRLPDGSALTLFEPSPDARASAEACAPIRLRLGVRTPSAADVSVLTTALLRERVLRDFEVLTSSTTPGGTETTLRVTIPAPTQ